MRIAHIIHGYPAESMGGTGLYVAALAHALAKANHTVAIVSPDPGGATRRVPRDGGVEAWCIATDPVRRWSDTWNGSVESWAAWCRSWRPDVVHVHHLSGWPLTLVEQTPCRTVVTLHDYAIPCARGQLLTPELEGCSGPTPAACTRCLGTALKSHPVINAVGQWISRVPKLYGWARQVASRRQHAEGAHPHVTARLEAAQKALEAADYLLSPSHDLAERMDRLGFGLPVHSELPLVRPAEPMPVSRTGPVRFLFASSIIPSKGIDRLVNCFERLTVDATLTIAGHAPAFDGHPGFAEALKRRADRIPGVTWLGAIPAGDIPTLMNQHDVLVLPSIWPENSPLVVREATAHGLHVIGPQIGGCSELAPDATLVQTEEELLAALQRECDQKRTRSSPREWPSPADHASHLLTTAYG